MIVHRWRDEYCYKCIAVFSTILIVNNRMTNIPGFYFMENHNTNQHQIAKNIYRCIYSVKIIRQKSRVSCIFLWHECFVLRQKQSTLVISCDFLKEFVAESFLSVTPPENSRLRRCQQHYWMWIYKLSWVLGVYSIENCAFEIAYFDALMCWQVSSISYHHTFIKKLIEAYLF